MEKKRNEIESKVSGGPGDWRAVDRRGAPTARRVSVQAAAPPPPRATVLGGDGEREGEAWGPFSETNDLAEPHKNNGLANGGQTRSTVSGGEELIHGLPDNYDCASGGVARYINCHARPGLLVAWKTKQRGSTRRPSREGKLNNHAKVDLQTTRTARSLPLLLSHPPFLHFHTFIVGSPSLRPAAVTRERGQRNEALSNSTLRPPPPRGPLIHTAPSLQSRSGAATAAAGSTARCRLHRWRRWRQPRWRRPSWLTLKNTSGRLWRRGWSL